MRVVVLGASGQLAQDLLRRLGPGAVGLDRQAFDLQRFRDCQSQLDALRPEVLINCAAYNLVDRAESEPESAFAINALALRELGLWCAANACLPVHFSTDHVFGLETRQQPWAETDLPGPVSVYGASKLSGEHLLRAACPRHLVVRTCGLYGLHARSGKGNFVETMLRLGRERPVLRVVVDQICTPTTTADLADAVLELLAAGVTGLVHRTNDGSCSWHEFACAILTASGIKTPVEPITSAQFAAPARRPAYSVLSSKLAPLRHWRTALTDYLIARSSKSALA